MQVHMHASKRTGKVTRILAHQLMDLPDALLLRFDNCQLGKVSQLGNDALFYHHWLSRASMKALILSVSLCHASGPADPNNRS